MKRDNTTRWLVSVAWLIAALTGILPPVLYYSRESNVLRSDMAASVEVQSLAIMRVINRHPETWRFHDNTMGDLIAFGRTKTDAGAAARMTRIIGMGGESIIENGEMPPLPHIVARAELYESGKAIGHLEQVGSLRPVWWTTLALALGSCVASLIVFFLLKWIPLRAIENAIRDARRAAADAKVALDEQLAAESRLNTANEALQQQAKIDTLLGRLAEVTNHASTPAEALSEWLKLVCEFTGWAIGHAALLRRDGDVAVACLNVWHAAAPERYAEFMSETERHHFPLKKGAFISRALNTGQPVWDRDLAQRGNFGRQRCLQQAGLASGIALPMPISGGLPGLIEFFTEQPVDPDPMLLAALERASMIIGRVIERQKSEEEIRQLNWQLEARIAQRTAELGRSNRVLEQRNQESERVTEMSNLIQTATDMQEAVEILSRLMGRLLAPHAGAIYLTAASLNRLDCLAQWGDAKAASIIGFDDCWGVRRARAYSVVDPRQDVFCTHVHADRRCQPYMCVPMMAQSTSLGVLHVQFVADAGVAEGSDVPAGERQRVQRLADQVAMALANLKLRQSLREQSIRDALTGLYNRRYLEESMERELSRATREAQPAVALMIDVDHFKRYNDQYGHEGGDAVLRALGRALREMLRTSDLAARYGGEEFTVLLYNATAAGGREWGERLRETVRQLEVKSDGQVLPPVTISLGLALFPDHGRTGAALLQAADRALYEAKRSGRDRLVVAGHGAEPVAAPSLGLVLAMPLSA